MLLRKLSRSPYLLPTLAILIATIFLWTRHPADPASAISLSFTGQISRGIHRNPFGQFIITNQGNRPIRWSRVSVEAPRDPDLSLSATLDSNIPHGTLPECAATNFQAMVPHIKDVPFRVLVSYAYEPRLSDQFREKLPDLSPVIDWVWPKTDGRRTFTSQWFYATTDYSTASNPLSSN